MTWAARAGQLVRKATAWRKHPCVAGWFLIHEATGKLAIKPNETTAFTIEQAIRFLRKLTDRQIAARQPARSGARMRASVY